MAHKCRYENLIYICRDKSNEDYDAHNFEAATKHFSGVNTIIVDTTKGLSVDPQTKIMTAGEDKHDLSKLKGNTLVFARVASSLQNLDPRLSQQVREALEWFDSSGMDVINSLTAVETACDKHRSAELLKHVGVPQPRYVLITPAVTNDPAVFEKKMREVVPGYGKDAEKDAETPVVIKILGGSHGRGVAKIAAKEVLAIAQMCFAIDTSANVIVQSFEKADGDLRIHVLTIKGEPKILAAMKRNQIKGDFRSNVSLGATTDAVKLTPNQEKVAMECAKASRLTWCAVDIMPLKEPTIDGYTDVVIEYNASPGVAGINAQIKDNMFNVVLDECVPGEIRKAHVLCGWKEDCQINETYKCRAELCAGDETVLYIKENNGNGVVKTHDNKNINAKSLLESVHVGMRGIFKVPVKILEGKETVLKLSRKDTMRLGYDVITDRTDVLKYEFL